MLVEKDDEYFFVGDTEWGVSVGYDIEDTAEILIPFSGSVKLTVVVSRKAQVSRGAVLAYHFGAGGQPGLCQCLCLWQQVCVGRSWL